jgi:hypothetical protein
METEATPALPILGGREFEEGSANLANNDIRGLGMGIGDPVQTTGIGGRTQGASRTGRDGTVEDRNRVRSYGAIRHSGRHTRVRIRTYGHAGRFNFLGDGGVALRGSVRSSSSPPAAPLTV